MEGASKGKRAHADADAAAGGLARDGLSSLPDGLLHAVLSCLGSRQVVQTCVLSRRWKNLWLSVPVLDLDDREFAVPTSSRTGSSRGEQVSPENVPHSHRFEEFGDNLLLHRAAASASAAPPPVQTVRLRVDDRTLRHTNCHRWVRRGLMSSPAALDVACSITLPSVAPGSRRLTRLRLDGVTVGEGVMEQLGALFPVLEDLELWDCSYSSPAQITSSTLKKLAIGNRQKRFDAAPLVAIAAPRLATLRLHVHTDRELNRMPWLDKNRSDYAFARNAAFLKSLRELLLASAAGATCIQLAGLSTAVVEKDCAVQAERFVIVPLLQAIFDEEVQKPPVFSNLRRLALAECDLGDDLRPLWRFLQNAPALENLYLRHCKLPDGLKRKKKGGKNMPGVAPNLKLVQIESNAKHAPNFHEVISDISRELQTATVHVIRV